MTQCRHCGEEVAVEFRYCPWCSTPQRRKLVEFFRGVDRDARKALRVSRYVPERRVGIEAPREVRAGVVIVVRVMTFTLSWDGRRIVDRQPERATFELTLSVRGPGGFYRELRLRRTRNSVMWRTKVALTTPGPWELSVVGWERAPRACAPPARIRVRG